jgi:hypothetical protein
VTLGAAPLRPRRARSSHRSAHVGVARPAPVWCCCRRPPTRRGAAGPAQSRHSPRHSVHTHSHKCKRSLARGASAKVARRCKLPGRGIFAGLSGAVFSLCALAPALARKRTHTRQQQRQQQPIHACQLGAVAGVSLANWQQAISRKTNKLAQRRRRQADQTSSPAGRRASACVPPGRPAG